MVVVLTCDVTTVSIFVRLWCTKFRVSCPCGHDPHGRVPLHSLGPKKSPPQPITTMSWPIQAVTHFCTVVHCAYHSGSEVHLHAGNVGISSWSHRELTHSMYPLPFEPYEEYRNTFWCHNQKIPYFCTAQATSTEQVTARSRGKVHFNPYAEHLGPGAKRSETSCITVLLSHTGHDAEHPGPVDDRRENSAKCVITSKTNKYVSALKYEPRPWTDAKAYVHCQAANAEFKET